MKAEDFANLVPEDVAEIWVRTYEAKMQDMNIQISY